MKLLFLDIDGVLNGHDYCPERNSSTILRDRVELLNHVLRRTGAFVVLSSAWRYFAYRGEMDRAGIDWLLRSHGMIADRLIGITRQDTMIRDPKWKHGQPWPMGRERGAQIADYLKFTLGLIGAHVDNYAILDDGGVEFDEEGIEVWSDLGILDHHPADRVVWTNRKLGLLWSDAERLIDILGVRHDLHA